jgi:hypothetical protein
VDGNNQSPDTFPGSEDGTGVTLGFGSYSVSEAPSPNVSHHNAGAQFSEDCKGVSIREKQRLVPSRILLIRIYELRNTWNKKLHFFPLVNNILLF